MGIHLHDIKGTQDHLAPGMGEFDFISLKPFLKRNTIKVIEVHQPATKDQLKMSITYLNKIGLNDF